MIIIDSNTLICHAIKCCCVRVKVILHLFTKHSRIGIIHGSDNAPIRFQNRPQRGDKTLIVRHIVEDEIADDEIEVISVLWQRLAQVMHFVGDGWVCIA